MTLRILFASSLLALTSVSPSLAQAAVKHTIDIPRQQLGSALAVLAKQTRIQLVYSADLVEGWNAPALSGQMTPEEALNRLLLSTGLKFEFLDAQTVTLLPDSAAHAPGTAPAAPAASSESPRGAATEKTPETSKGFWSRLRLAQAAPASDSRTDAPGPAAEATPAATGGPAVPEVLIKGSKSLNMDIKRTRDDAQPYMIFDEEKIQSSGATNVEDFLKTRLTMNTSGVTAGQSAANITGAASNSINLRGLGTGQTLILIDGHRVADFNTGSTIGQADINNIPVAAIERIEVLPTTSSGIYGGGATGGVVNVILKRDYQGVEASYTYGNTFDTDVGRKRADLAAGFSLEGGRTNILFNASYSDANRFLTRDRDFVQDGVARIIANNPTTTTFFTATPPLGATPNIRSQSGANLVLKNGTALNSPMTSVPYGYAGPTTDGGNAFVANAGKFNYDLANDATNSNNAVQGGAASLLNAPRVESTRLTVRREFTDNVHAFADLSASNSLGRSMSVSLVDTFALAAGAANNPFQQAITVTVPNGTLDEETTTMNKDRRAVAGAIVKLPFGWQAEGDVTWQKYALHVDGYATTTQQYTADVTAGLLDVLRDPAVYPLDLHPYAAVYRHIDSVETRMLDYSLRASGPLISLPTGPVQLSGLLERRSLDMSAAKEIATWNNTYSYDPPRQQDIDSLYLELRVPLLRAAEGGQSPLELQLAGRTDRYVTDGGAVASNVTIGLPPPTVVRGVNRLHSTNPTIALRYQPLQDVVMRASYGTGFQPPSLTQLVSTTSTVLPGAINDPKRGNTLGGAFMSYSGGNADLRPEKSKSWSLGAILTPRFAPGWRLSLDYLDLRKTDNIAGSTAGSFQGMVDSEELNPGRVVRGPNLPGDPAGWAGPVQIIDFRQLNGARAKLRALDMQLDYVTRLQVGTVSLFALGTRTFGYETQLTPLAAEIENVGVGRSNPLEWKANAGASFARGQWSFTWSAYFFDSYLVSTTPLTIANQANGGIVPSQTYHDVYASYRVGGADTNRWLTGLDVQAGVRNVFNHSPPFDANGFGAYYSQFGDPRLANYYVTLKKAF